MIDAEYKRNLLLEALDRKAARLIDDLISNNTKFNMDQIDQILEVNMEYIDNMKNSVMDYYNNYS